MTNALVPSAVDPDVSAALQIYERIKPLKDSLGIQNLTDAELQVFAYVARYTGLDPFTKQIYAIKRGGRVTHQTGIDGYRSVAERSGQYAGSDEATFEECDCGDEKDSPANHPKLARVIVHRIRPDGARVSQTGVARWHELKPPHAKYPNANDFQDAMWWRQPFNQLAKCAEANGLRKAFPRVLGGVYISDEMQGTATVIEGEASEVETAPKTNQSTAARVAARRAERQAQLPAATSTSAPDPEPADEGSFVEVPAEPAAEPSLADTIRAVAIADGHDQPATKAEVAALLEGMFADWDRNLVRDGVIAIFGVELADHPTKAVVAALRAAGEAIPGPALVTAWRELVKAAAG